MTQDTHRWRRRLSASFGDMWCGRPGCASCRGLRMQAGRLHHKLGGEPKDIGMVQTQAATPNRDSVGNALRGGPADPERHGVVPYGTTAGLLPETSMNWTMPNQ